MFGSQPRTRRPLLLILVFGVFLGDHRDHRDCPVVHGFAALLDGHAEYGRCQRFRHRPRVPQRIREAALPRPGNRAQRERTNGARGAARSPDSPEQILRVELRRLDGTIVAASAPGLAGIADGHRRPRRVPHLASPGRDRAVGGGRRGAGDLGSPRSSASSCRSDRRRGPRRRRDLARRRARSSSSSTDVRRDVVVVTLSAAIIAALLLFLIFRSAQGRLTRQTAALVEATRRDPLTGHPQPRRARGAPRRRDRARPSRPARRSASPSSTSTTSGCSTTTTATAPATWPSWPSSTSFARHLPDVGRDGSLRPGRVPARRTGRCRRRDGARRRAPPDRARRPEPPVRGDGAAAGHGQRRPVHLPGARLVGHAPAGGRREHARGGEGVRRRHGPGRRLARRATPSRPGSTSSRVSSSRSTRRTATRSATRRTSPATASSSPAGSASTRSSSARSTSPGLLHDVGKIGIPDPILRKPGKLTAAEYDIVKQHVALGDMIVRDVPDIEIVRAGIRHHHERWDGDGYLDRLEGEEIPLIARILAVGDAFSAMTTTRPYRKALDLREALDAARGCRRHAARREPRQGVRRGDRDGSRRPAARGRRAGRRPLDAEAGRVTRGRRIVRGRRRGCPGRAQPLRGLHARGCGTGLTYSAGGCRPTSDRCCRPVHRETRPANDDSADRCTRKRP